MTYGSLSIDHSETMKEIGELGLDIWRRQMIEPLKVKTKEKYLSRNQDFDLNVLIKYKLRICINDLFLCYQSDLVALLLNGIRYDRLGESGSKTGGGYQVLYFLPYIFTI